MFKKSRILSVIIGVSLLACASFVYADAAAVAKIVADYKAVSQELTALYAGATTEANAKAVEAKINAATDKLKADENAMQAEMQKFDLNSDQAGMIIEMAYAEMKAVNEAVAAAQMKALELQAVAKANK